MSDTTYEVGTITSVDKNLGKITLSVAGKTTKEFKIARHNVGLLKKAVRAMLDGFAVVLAIGNEKWINNISKLQPFKHDDEYI